MKTPKTPANPWLYVLESIDCLRERASRACAAFHNACLDANAESIRAAKKAGYTAESIREAIKAGYAAEDQAGEVDADVEYAARRVRTIFGEKS
jgi:hypothetical protein